MAKIIPILLFFFLALPSQSRGEQPLEILQGAVDGVISILEDPAYQDPSQKKVQQKKLWEIIRGIFDFNEMARSTLARHWKEFTEEQKKEFSDVFGQFLGGNYLDKIQSGFKGEKVVYLGHETVSDNKVMVKTKIVRETLDIPVDYRMMFLNGSWRVYDVKIEGVSLIKNYRAQFHDILIKESPDTLIKMMRKKVEEKE